MNRERRKQIVAARALIDKGKALLDEARDMLETIKDDEQAAQTGQGPAAPQERKCHVQDPGGAAWPPRIV